MKLDERAKELARIVVDYSTETKKGDMVVIGGEMIAAGFMEEIARNVIDKGAYPILNYSNPQMGRYTYEHASDEMLARLPKFAVARAEECDVNISVAASQYPLILQGVDPKKIGIISKSRRPLHDIIIGDGDKHKGKRWLVVGYPTAGDAKMGGLNLNQYANILYGATNIDWAKTSEEMKKVKDVFDNADDVQIYVPGLTDLHLSLKGRGGEICDGKLNMPDGEVFYGPDEYSAQGYITFSYPAVRAGNLVEGIRLEYEQGRIVKYSAKKNNEFLEAMVNLDGVKRIGELGIGCNYGVKRYMKNLLFDEKIGGTIHIAIGESYKCPLDKGGGKNKADIHWDIVCDLRKTGNNPGGWIKVNGKPVQENGAWLF